MGHQSISSTHSILVCLIDPCLICGCVLLLLGREANLTGRRIFPLPVMDVVRGLDSHVCSAISYLGCGYIRGMAPSRWMGK
jgi:hypothetical protein